MVDGLSETMLHFNFHEYTTRINDVWLFLLNLNYYFNHLCFDRISDDLRKTV
jgi:hypothetical protein